MNRFDILTDRPVQDEPDRLCILPCQKEMLDFDGVESQVNLGDKFDENAAVIDYFYQVCVPVKYIKWTVTLKNKDPVPQRTRFEILKDSN